MQGLTFKSDVGDCLDQAGEVPVEDVAAAKEAAAPAVDVPKRVGKEEDLSSAAGDTAHVLFAAGAWSEAATIEVGKTDGATAEGIGEDKDL